MEEIHRVVEYHAQQIVQGVRVSLMGSYARGAPDSGDVDILIVPPEGQQYLRHDFLYQLVHRLGPPTDSTSGGSGGGIGFLTDHFNADKLAISKPPHGVRSYMGRWSWSESPFTHIVVFSTSSLTFSPWPSTQVFVFCRVRVHYIVGLISKRIHLALCPLRPSI